MSMLPARLVVLAAALHLSGCTVIHVHGSDDVEVRRGFGIVSLQIKPGAGATVVDSASFGAISGPDGFTLGYHAATAAQIERGGCHLVVWVNARDQLAALQELLAGRTDVCTIQPQQYAKGDTP